MTTVTTSTSTRLLRLREVLHRIGVGRTTLYRWVRLGQFPRPRSLTPNGSTVAWMEAEVEAWITSKPATSGGTSWGTFASDAPQAA
nr:AlpA family phage regulatory protein [Rhodanobacter sp. PCA2]